MSLIVSGAFRQPDIDKSKKKNIINFIFTENTFATGINPKASQGVLYPPLCGIVQLTNSAVLLFRNWSFTNDIVCSYKPFLSCKQD